MNSGTLTEAATRKPAPDTNANTDAAFRPWHFFLLVSLMMATVAVMMSRRATPEHLVLMSMTIIAAGVAAAGFYRTLAPLAAEDVATFSEPLSDRGRSVLEREKRLALRAIKELEFDRAMGKVSPKDFDEMAGRLRARAIALMKQLEEGADYREVIERELQARLKTSVPAPVVARTGACSCGTANDVDAAFCKRCGAKL